MSAIIYERNVQTDPTAGLSLKSTRDPNLEQTRYLFCPGQFLDPERVNQLDYIRDAGGGEEVEAHTLRRTKGKFIPRAWLTPLEIWADPMPAELIGEGLERDTVVIAANANYAAPPTNGVTARPGFFVGKSLKHVKYYPGDEIKSILNASNSRGHRGIVEITSLLGHEWYADPAETKPGAAQLLNADFFPRLPPIQLKGLQEMIEKAADRSDLHNRVGREMQQSCTLFKRWAETVLAAEHVLLRQRVSSNGQHVYTYSPLGRTLLEQLDMKPQDSLFESGMSSGIDMDQMKQLAATFSGNQITPEMIGQIAGVIAQQFMAAQKANPASEDASVMGSAPEETAKPSPPPDKKEKAK
jgi:hypothetical protein